MTTSPIERNPNNEAVAHRDEIRQALLKAGKNASTREQMDMVRRKNVALVHAFITGKLDLATFKEKIKELEEIPGIASFPTLADLRFALSLIVEDSLVDDVVKHEETCGNSK